MKKKRGHSHSLTRYIDDQLNSGFSKETIKQHLINYGHEIHIIEESFRQLNKKKFSILSKSMISLCIGIAIFLMLWVALSTEAKISHVLAGFLPTILCLIISITLIEKPKHRNLNVLWALPFILSVLFWISGSSVNLEIFKAMDVNKLVALNFVISFAFIFILYLTGSLKQDEIEIINEKPIKKKITEIKLKDEKDIKEYLQSIEDKCKAINFAIGRVYSNKKGGSEDVRNTIKIKKEWYNEISNILKGGYDKKRDRNKILLNIKKIKDRLERLHKTEKEIFKEKHHQLRSLKRDEQGMDKILHTLIKNDKDPIKSYYDGAIEFCSKIMKGL